MVTISTPSIAPQSGSIVPIDMSKLTQSDLQTLSLTSSILSSERLFIPTIDRSLFNESAGSLRQTYSHHESSPSTGVHQHRNRFAGFVRASEAPEADEDPVRRENMSILKILRNYINSDLFSQNIDLMTPSLSAPVGLDRERKRKRGKVPIHAETENVDLLEIKNKHGIEIDVEALSGLVDPYSEELRRRTEGLVTEEELLGFFRGLGGEWGSRRKKRKIVDAGIFGDLLPVGWKLLLGLRRREGRISVYCRRYVSPAGQQFISCTEISSYMQSYLRLKDASKPAAQSRDGIQQVFKVDSENNAVAAEKDDSQSAGIIDSSSGTSRSLSRPLVKEVVKSGVENWTQDVFECRKCNINFPEQDAYLEHLLSLHQRATRKYRLGSSVGDGVIMKNGKFECQFCHKVFDERRRYNGHVGIHVRDYVRRNGESPAQGSGHSNLESSSRNCFPPNFSKMNALLEIAQCSILETSTNEENGGGLSGVPAHGKPNHDSFESLPDATPKDGKSSRKVKGFYVESFSTANREGEVKLGHMRMEEIEVGKTPDEDFAVNESIAIVKAELDNSNNSNAIEHANFVTGSAMVDQNGFAEKNISDAKLDSKIDIVEETMSEVSTVPLRANTKPSQSTGNSLCGTDLSAKF